MDYLLLFEEIDKLIRDKKISIEEATKLIKNCNSVEDLTNSIQRIKEETI